METQFEIDFRQWLRELSRDVVVRYGRWLEDEDGVDEQNDYCTECVEQEVADHKAKQDPFTEIDGWDEARESDTAWQQKLLKPVGPEDQWRAQRLQQWDRLHEALEKVFYFEAGDGELREKLTDALMGVEGGAMTQHRIRLKGAVARTVFRWAKEAAKQEPKKKAKR